TLLWDSPGGRIDTLESSVTRLQKLADDVPRLEASLSKLSSESHEEEQ
ncbi:jg942, partial [Pararge aegeria aegeria]